jgi:lysozyme
MKNRTYTIRLIQEHEGLRLKPYRCSAGKLTIGFGRNLSDVGVTHGEAFYLLMNDIHECVRDLRGIFPGVYDGLPTRVQSALIDMRYQLGYGGFRSFKKMIQAVKEGNRKLAATEMRNSKWAVKDTPERAEELASLVEGG